MLAWLTSRATRPVSLIDAWNHGAGIFCESKVSHVERSDEYWIVHFTPVGAGRERFDAPELFVTADVVVIAAGALGNTEILLRSTEAGLSGSTQLGKRFTGNGDVLAFGYNVEHGVSLQRVVRGEWSRPVLTSRDRQLWSHRLHFRQERGAGCLPTDSR